MTRHKDVRVAFRAIVHAGMDLMTEEHGATIIFKGHIAGRVTLGAIPFDREGARAVVTGPTGGGFFFHRFHRRREARFGRIDIEERVMAGRTVLPDFFQMDIMTKLNWTSRIAVHCNFVL